MAGQHLDGGAIAVAGGEIHLAISRPRAQAGLDQAGRFKEIGPIHFRQAPHRGDDIAHRDIRRALPGLSRGDDRLNRQP